MPRSPKSSGTLGFALHPLINEVIEERRKGQGLGRAMVVVGRGKVKGTR